MSKIKILHVLSDTNIGGAGVVLLNQLKHFDKDKFLIKVILPQNSKLKPEIENLGYEVIETQNGADKSLDRRTIPEFMRIFKREKPNIVHTHSSMSARIAAKLRKVKTRVFTKHCVEGSSRLHGIAGNMLSTHVIATDYASREALLQSGVKPKKITVIINGVDPLRTLTDEEKAKTRGEFGIKDSDFVFGITGRLEPIKGQKYFIEAAKIVSEKYDNCKFVIVGTGGDEDSLKRQTIDVGLNVGRDALGTPRDIADKVIFTGFLTDISAITNIMDVIVNCSDSETSCLALSEAFSLAKPAIATNGGGNPYMVINGDNGLIVPIRDSEAIAADMETMMIDKDMYSGMSETARKHYLEKFTAEVMTRQLENIYVGAIINRPQAKGDM